MEDPFWDHLPGDRCLRLNFDLPVGKPGKLYFQAETVDYQDTR